MFKQIKYRVVTLRPELKIEDVSRIDLDTAGLLAIAGIKDSKGEIIKRVQIDGDESMLIEFTGKFSKEGKPIWTGDILELKEAHGQAPAGLYVVAWVPGSFMAFHVHDTVSVPLFDEACVVKMEHLGNQFENADVLNKYLEQFKDVELKAADLP